MNDKEICCCHSVKLSDMKKFIEEGGKDFVTFQELTKIGTDCPPCKENNEALFNEMLHQK